MSAWLDALLGRIKDLGTAIPIGYGLNFIGGVRARPNTSTKFIDIDLRDASIGPTHLAASSGGVAATFVLRIPMTSGVVGAAADVESDEAPCALRILDRWADITTAIGGSSVTLRDVAGGVGDTLSGVISTAAIGEGIRAATGAVSAQTTLAAGETVFVRQSDRGIRGTVYMLCERTS